MADSGLLAELEQITAACEANLARMRAEIEAGELGGHHADRVDTAESMLENYHALIRKYRAAQAPDVTVTHYAAGEAGPPLGEG
jgi:hypothetical protein